MVPSHLYCIACGTANPAQAKFCFACGQPLQASVAAATTGTLTGLLSPNHLLKQRYCILSKVGAGGFAAVYKATDTSLGNRPVAVKEMSLSGLSPPEVSKAVDAFEREAKLLAGLMHPNLPRIYDHFDEAGRWYLVMDFIEGESLEKYLCKTGGRLPLIQEALDIGIQLCSVLDYLHTRRPMPIIFRDLKPDNIMRASDGHLYLIDFGIARHFKPGQAKDTTAFGSPGYAAPEQYGKAQTTPQSDIYSLGAVLHQMLSGHDPSTNTPNPFTFPPPPNVSVELERLIWQMVQINAADRPTSMTAVKQELQLIATQPIGKTPTPLIQPPNPPQRSLLTISHQLMHQLPQLAHATLVQIHLNLKKALSKVQALITSASTAVPLRKKGVVLLLAGIVILVILSLLTGVIISFIPQTTLLHNPYPPKTGLLALDDPLSDNTRGYSWEEGQRDGGYCTFTGGTYHSRIPQEGVAHSCLALAKESSGNNVVN